MSQIQEVELSIEQAQGLIKKGERALKLAENKDFKELVLDGYLVQEAARLAHLSADLTLDVNQRADVILMVQAVGFFKAFMQRLVREGNIAARDLAAHRETLSELHNEGAED